MTICRFVLHAATFVMFMLASMTEASAANLFLYLVNSGATTHIFNDSLSADGDCGQHTVSGELSRSRGTSLRQDAVGESEANMNDPPAAVTPAVGRSPQHNLPHSDAGRPGSPMPQRSPRIGEPLTDNVQRSGETEVQHRMPGFRKSGDNFTQVRQAGEGHRHEYGRPNGVNHSCAEHGRTTPCFQVLKVGDPVAGYLLEQEPNPLRVKDCCA